MKKNKVKIKDIEFGKKITLLLKIYIDNIEKDIEIILLYNKENLLNNNRINNEIKNLKIEIINLKNEIIMLKKNINDIKNFNNKKEYIKNAKIELINYSNPENITFSTIITKDSYTYFDADNTISVFKSIDDILLLLYINENNSIISYNLNNNQMIQEIKNAHNKNITNIRNYFDSFNERDLILSISSEDNNLKIWDITFNCLVNLKNVNQDGFLFSGTILYYNYENYIITTNSSSDECEPIKIFDFKGNKLNEINNSNYFTNIMDTYYDNNYDKNYIITGNKGCVISYDLNENKIYNNYYESGDKYDHNSIVINNISKIIKLIESSDEGIIRIWDFHMRILMNRINVINERLLGICLWNNNSIFVGCEDYTIRLININNGEIIKSLSGHREEIATIKKIIHPKYGECLVSYGGDIILWTKNK